MYLKCPTSLRGAKRIYSGIVNDCGIPQGQGHVRTSSVIEGGWTDRYLNDETKVRWNCKMPSSLNQGGSLVKMVVALVVDTLGVT